MKKKKTCLWIVVVTAALLGSLISSASTTATENKVVVYSTHDEAILELVADMFTKETGIKVDFINLKGALADRIRVEKSNPQADVMYGAPSSVYIELKKEGLFTPYRPKWSGKLNPMFKDPDGYWFGTIQTPVVLFYNTEMIKTEEAPKDWQDLTAPRYKNQLVFRNALSSSARATYCALLQQYEKQGNLDTGWAFLKAVDVNTKQYYDSGSLMFQAIGRKEASISFAVLNDVMDNATKNKIPITAVNAVHGSPVITDGIALIARCPHQDNGQMFIDFAGNAKTQAVLANSFSRIPTNPEAIPASPKWMAEITVKPMDVDWEALSATQSAWMQKWDATVKDSSKDKN